MGRQWEDMSRGERGAFASDSLQTRRTLESPLSQEIGLPRTITTTTAGIIARAADRCYLPELELRAILRQQGFDSRSADLVQGRREARQICRT